MIDLCHCCNKEKLGTERLRTRMTFYIVADAVVAKMGYTAIVWFDIYRSRSHSYGAYFHDVLLSQQLLPIVRQISGKFIFSN